jgi:hypothetical protein
MRGACPDWEQSCATLNISVITKICRNNKILIFRDAIQFYQWLWLEDSMIDVAGKPGHH